MGLTPLLHPGPFASDPDYSHLTELPRWKSRLPVTDSERSPGDTALWAQHRTSKARLHM